MNDNIKLDKVQEDTILELKQYPNWVFWRIELVDDQIRKVPYTIYNKKARTNDSQTWTNFDIVNMVYQNDPEKYDGIGFVFSENDPFVFIDLDKCIDEETGEIYDDKSKIVNGFSSGGALVERSQSGVGIHIITKGKLYGGVNRHEQGIEIYSTKRFVALTFDLTNQSTKIDYTQKLIDELVKEYKPEQKIHSLANGFDLNISHKFKISYKVWKAFTAINNGRHGRSVIVNDKEYNTRSEAEGYIIMQLIAHGYSFEEGFALFKKYNKGSFADEPNDKQYGYLNGYWENALKEFHNDYTRLKIRAYIQNVPNLVFDNKRSEGSMRRILLGILKVAYQFRTVTPMVSLHDLQIMTGLSLDACSKNTKRLRDEGFILIDKTKRTNTYHLTGKVIVAMRYAQAPTGNKELFMATITLRQTWLFKHLGGSTEQIYAILTKDMTTKEIAVKINRSPTTARVNLYKLRKAGIVEKKSHLLWGVIEDINWDNIDEEYNISLQIGAMKDFVKQERDQYNEKYQEWKENNSKKLQY